MFALFSGLVGTAFSVLIRLELSGPGVQYIADNQLYNAIITAHAIVMIFFMVEKCANTLSVKLARYTTEINSINSSDKCDVKVNSNEDNKGLKPERNYTKILVEDPYNNRNIILKLTKRQKGVYV